MGRDFGPAYKFFELLKESSNGKSERFKCRFCGSEYQRNHTKMLRHLQKQCKLVSNLAKQQLSGVQEELNNPSSSASANSQGSEKKLSAISCWSKADVESRGIFGLNFTS